MVTPATTGARVATRVGTVASRMVCAVGMVCVATALAPGSPTPLRYFASCAGGMEEVLASELRSPPINARTVRASSRGVEFESPGGASDHTLGYRALLWLRTANKVMELLTHREGNMHTREDLYDMVYGCGGDVWRWSDVMGPQNTLCVSVAAGDTSGGELAHNHYTALTVKNAICDYFRTTHNDQRPSVHTTHPDMPLHLYLHRDTARLYRSLGGAGSLHKRGYRSVMHRSSLRETLAAGVVLHSGWTPDTPLCDPMCGSGTIAIEAALIGRNVAPGLLRLGLYGDPKNTHARREQGEASPWPCCTRWRDADHDQWQRVVQEAQEAVAPRPAVPIFANDVHPIAIDMCMADARNAGVAGDIVISHSNVRDFSTRLPTTAAACRPLVVSNPPWGLRLGGAEEAWEQLGTFLRREVGGGSAWLLSGNPEVTRALRMRATSKHPVSSGGADLRLLRYDVFPARP